MLDYILYGQIKNVSEFVRSFRRQSNCEIRMEETVCIVENVDIRMRMTQGIAENVEPISG